MEAFWHKRWRRYLRTEEKIGNYSSSPSASVFVRGDNSAVVKEEPVELDFDPADRRYCFYLKR